MRLSILLEVWTRQLTSQGYVDKVLRTLLKRFDTKVSTLKEKKDLDNITTDELHGILATYEMRIEIDQPSKK